MELVKGMASKEGYEMKIDETMSIIHLENNHRKKNP